MPAVDVLKKGGRVRNTAGPKIGKDDGFVSAQKGEYVVKRSAVKKLGAKAMNTINQGKIPNGKSSSRSR